MVGPFPRVVLHELELYAPILEKVHPPFETTIVVEAGFHQVGQRRRLLTN
jgi:hypothetical protein